MTSVPFKMNHCSSIERIQHLLLTFFDGMKWFDAIQSGIEQGSSILNRMNVISFLSFSVDWFVQLSQENRFSLFFPFFSPLFFSILIIIIIIIIE